MKRRLIFGVTIIALTVGSLSGAASVRKPKASEIPGTTPPTWPVPTPSPCPVPK